MKIEANGGAISHFRPRVIPFCLVACLYLGAPDASARPAARPDPATLEMAITIDDLPLGGEPLDLAATQTINARLLEALARNKIPATGFVNEQKLHVTGEVDARISILRSWIEA